MKGCRSLTAIRRCRCRLGKRTRQRINLCQTPARKDHSADPTDGFTRLPLSRSNFILQKPYSKASSDRYSYFNGVHKLWVLSTDKPFKPETHTGPRTEIRISGYDYSEGVWQFEGHVFVREGTSEASIMQVHRLNGQKPATDLMLFVTDGDLRVYSGKQIKSDVYNRWMRVNVIHNVEANMLTVFIDGVQKLKRKGNGRSKFYFKFGVYAQLHASRLMESRWKGIKIFKK